MFCFQCQETMMNRGCTVGGACGKPETTSNLQDLLLFVCKGVSVYGERLVDRGGWTGRPRGSSGGRSSRP